VAYQRCGKLIVATSPEQVPQLEAIRQKAAANGVDDLVHLTREQARELEPRWNAWPRCIRPAPALWTATA
jgi:L-2-hydroxyglutarate oxidase LhgO